MPVRAWIGEGRRTPGLTSVDQAELTSKPSISSTAISVMRSPAGSEPVVSTSTMASGAPRVTVYLSSRGVTLPEKRADLVKREAEDRNTREHVDAAQKARPDLPPQPAGRHGEDRPPRRRAEEHAEHDPRRRLVVRARGEAEAGEDRCEGEDGRRIGERQAERRQEGGGQTECSLLGSPDFRPG